MNVRGGGGESTGTLLKWCRKKKYSPFCINLIATTTKVVPVEAEDSESYFLVIHGTMYLRQTEMRDETDYLTFDSEKSNFT